MKSSGREMSVLFRQISWIAVGVVGFGVLVGAVLLAMDASPGAAPPAVASKYKTRRVKGNLRKSRYMAPKRTKYKLPMVPVTKGKGKRPPTLVDRPPTGRARRPGVLHNKAKNLRRPVRPGLAAHMRPGRLSQEELQKRRDERRKRQVERLRKRIGTLEDRIESYKQDGTRTEAQISRMERSLDRMKKRLKRMEDQQKR